MPYKNKEDARAYREANKEKIAAYSISWYQANKEKAKAYREANKEKIAAYNISWYAANKEKAKAVRKAHREANKEEKAAYDKAYYEANKERRSAAKRIWQAANKEKEAATKRAWREANKENAVAKDRAWKEANPDRCNAYVSRRKALKLKLIPKHLKKCPVEKQRVLDIYKLRILISKATGVKHHVDHMWPLSDGGPHWSGNLQIITAYENLSKHASVDLELKHNIQQSLKETM